jgi:phage anti-repressor protein/predicted GIY-YIG superfamily endonuclease
MIPAKAFIKKLTTVPEQFIDELFDLYDIETLQTDFVIILDVVAKWLNTRKDILLRTLQKTYKQQLDYIKVHPKEHFKDQAQNRYKRNYTMYLLTPDCFKRLAMMSKSKNAEMIRTYFIEIEGLFIKYRAQTLMGMQQDIERLERNQKPKGDFEPKQGYLYIVRASDMNDGLYKIGRSKDLIQRLRQYTLRQMNFATPNIEHYSFNKSSLCMSKKDFLTIPHSLKIRNALWLVKRFYNFYYCLFWQPFGWFPFKDLQPVCCIF